MFAIDVILIIRKLISDVICVFIVFLIDLQNKTIPAKGAYETGLSGACSAFADISQKTTACIFKKGKAVQLRQFIEAIIDYCKYLLEGLLIFTKQKSPPEADFVLKS